MRFASCSVPLRAPALGSLVLSPPRESRCPSFQQVIAGYPGHRRPHFTGAQGMGLLSSPGCSWVIGVQKESCGGLSPMWALVASVSLMGSVCRPKVPHGEPSWGFASAGKPAMLRKQGPGPECTEREMWSQPRKCQGHQKLQEARVSSPPEPAEECHPAAPWLWASGLVI